jgi:uncharacterized membrane protein YkoI
VPYIRGKSNPQEIEMKKFVTAIITTSAIAFAVPAHAYSGQELAKDAKITIKEARAIALKAHPGKVTDEELEKEKGGSGLRYSFDIKHGKVTQEVGVDAVTGKVLENAAEGPNPD